MKTTHVIWRLIAYIPWRYWINTFFWILATLVELVPGLLAKAFFDRLSGSAPVSFSINGIIALVLVTAVMHMLFLAMGIFLDTRTRFTHSLLLRRNLLRSILDRPGARAILVPPGEAISTFRDDAQVLEDTADWLIDMIAVFMFAAVALVIMLRVNAHITAFTVLPLAGVLLAAQAASNRIKRYRRASRRATEKVTGALGEVLSAVQAIQLANAERHVRDHVERLNNERRQMMVQDSLLRQVLDSIFVNSAALGTGLILILTAGAMRSGSFTLGDFALFVYYLGLLANFTAFFGNFLAQFKQAGISFERMVDLLTATANPNEATAIPEVIVAHNPVYFTGDVPEVTPPAKRASDQLVRLGVTGLTFYYPDSGNDSSTKKGITDISFTLEKGSFTVITGRIGAGKTTLLRTLLGLLPLQAGAIYWNGVRVIDPATFFVPPRSAYTPQVSQLFSTTLKENILLEVPEEEANLSNAVYRAVLEKDVAVMADGLETMVGSKGVRLSGGQIQRSAAARMFVREPALLVFDDLSSALDVETEYVLWERLFQRDNLPTCLVVSHRRTALRRADQVLVLKEGRVVDEGSLDELLERCEEMQRLWKGDLRDEQ